VFYLNVAIHSASFQTILFYNIYRIESQRERERERERRREEEIDRERERERVGGWSKSVQIKGIK
jgi:hypothetical protein